MNISSLFARAGSTLSTLLARTDAMLDALLIRRASVSRHPPAPPSPARTTASDRTAQPSVNEVRAELARLRTVQRERHSSPDNGGGTTRGATPASPSMPVPPRADIALADAYPRTVFLGRSGVVQPPRDNSPRPPRCWRAGQTPSQAQAGPAGLLAESPRTMYLGPLVAKGLPKEDDPAYPQTVYLGRRG